MSNVHSAKFESVVSSNAVDEAIHDALHLFVGRQRPFSVKLLQRKSGVSHRMIESAMAPVGGENFRPLNRQNFWSIANALGAGFLNHIAPKLANIGTFDMPANELPNPGEVAADSAEDNAQIARCAADGKFCANDRRTLWLVGQEYIERGMQLVGLGKQSKANAA